MRTALGIPTALLVLAVLAGCGDDPPDGAGDDTHRSPSSAAPRLQQVALLSATAAGGEVTQELTRLPDDAAVAGYAARFTNETLVGQIRRTAAETQVPDGQELAAAVVAIGCEKPTAVVPAGADGVRAVVPSTTKECLAPVTTVALVLVAE